MEMLSKSEDICDNFPLSSPGTSNHVEQTTLLHITIPQQNHLHVLFAVLWKPLYFTIYCYVQT